MLFLRYCGKQKEASASIQSVRRHIQDHTLGRKFSEVEVGSLVGIEGRLDLAGHSRTGCG